MLATAGRVHLGRNRTRSRALRPCGRGQIPKCGTSRQSEARAIKKAIAREGISVDQLDVIEINEAFAAVALASTKELGVDPQKVNVNGGAIAIGHPIGMSGARITLHAALELGRRGSGYAVAALCGAGGQGDALILRAG